MWSHFILTLEKVYEVSFRVSQHFATAMSYSSSSAPVTTCPSTSRRFIMFEFTTPFFLLA